MLGLQTLDLSNTRIKGSIPEELGSLPFLMSVDIRNTLMSCCSNMSQADAARSRVDSQGWPPPRTPSKPPSKTTQKELLPGFLVFNIDQKRSPLDERMPGDPFLRKYMATGEHTL
jgi:hypothetical protein